MGDNDQRLGKSEDAHPTLLPPNEVDVEVKARGKNKPFWDVYKDKRYRRKLLYSFCLASSLFCVWFVETQPGTTFLDLQLLTGSTIGQASWFFSIHTIGYLLGCVLAAILPKMMRPDLVISLGLLAMGVSVITTPLCSSYSIMMFNRCITGVFPGIVESVIYAEQMRTWGDEGKSVTQLVMLLGSGGLFLAPVVSEPFLAADRGHNAEQNRDDNYSNKTTDYLGSGAFSFNLTTASIRLKDDHNRTFDNQGETSDAEFSYPATNLLYAFLITGGLSILTSLIFVVMSRIIGHTSSKVKTANEVSDGIKYRTIPLSLKVTLISGFCLFVMFISMVGISFVSFLMTFLVNEYDHMTKSDGAYILTLFFCCGSATHVLLIFLADRILAKYLLSIAVVLVFVSFPSFTAIATLGETTVLIVLTGLMNVGLSPALPLILTWCQEDYLEVTNVLSSCVTFSSALGVLSNPLLLSYCMENIANMWFCYLLTIEAFVTLAIFILMTTFNALYVRRKYGPLKVSMRSEKNDDRAMSHQLKACV